MLAYVRGEVFNYSFLIKTAARTGEDGKRGGFAPARHRKRFIFHNRVGINYFTLGRCNDVQEYETTVIPETFLTKLSHLVSFLLTVIHLN